MLLSEAQLNTLKGLTHTLNNESGLLQTSDLIVEVKVLTSSRGVLGVIHNAGTPDNAYMLDVGATA